MKRLLPFAILSFIALITALGLSFLGDEPQEIHRSSEATALSGRLVDDAQRPIKEGFVFVGDQATRTAADGTFSFPNLPPGEFEVDASADGYIRPGSGSLGRIKVQIEPEPPQEELQLTLPRAASLSGTILAGDEPLYGATLSLSYTEAKGIANQELEPFILAQAATSDAQGVFSLDAVAPGRLQILVDSPEYPFAESQELVIVPGQKLTELRIDVAPAGGIRGSVVDQEGEPLRAKLTLISQKDGRRRSTFSDDQGRYQFRTLRAGDYQLRVQADGHQIEQVDGIIVEADQVFDQDIMLIPQSLLLGRVLDIDGNPVGGAYIRLINQDQTHQLNADDQGHFSLETKHPRGWLAQAFSLHHDPSRLVSLTPGKEALLELPSGGTITGEVVDPQGRIITGYRISAASLDTQNPYATPHQIPTLYPQDERGRFEFGPLPSGRVRLEVMAKGYPTKITDSILIRGGQRTGPLRIQLDEGADLEGYVSDIESGEPIPGAQVFLLSQNRQRPLTTTDQEGRFFISSLPSGLQTLQLVHDDYLTEIFNGISIPAGGSLSRDFELIPTGDGPPGYTFHGIGAALRRQDDQIQIFSLEEGSPAALAGLQIGDQIRAVDGQKTELLTLDQAVEYIRGEGEEPVRLQIYRQGQGLREHTIHRDRIIITRQDRR